MNVFLIGAGASKAYDQSPTGCRMPLAKEVFATFEKLDISSNLWVLIGKILNYARDKKHIPLDAVFKRNYDIEAFHSEVEADLNEAIARRGGQHGLTPEMIELNGVFTQLSFFFSSVINEIQNGPLSLAHCNLVSQLDPNDCVITFNWDTLIDRALHQAGNWDLESGYGFSPREIFRDDWIQVTHKTNPKAVPRLIKLHGSTNWITSYPGIDLDEHKPFLIQDAPNDTVRVFEYSAKPYACYAGRYMGGYEPFSYGYYPPNITNDKGKSAPPGQVFVTTRPKFPFVPEGTAPDDGIPSFPLIIPPVKNKSYDLFGSLFQNLWQVAEQALRDCDRLYVIGYSFPDTDIRSIELFKRAFVARRSIPRVVIVNPDPDRNIQILSRTFGIPNSHIEVRKCFFDAAFKK